MSLPSTDVSLTMETPPEMKAIAVRPVWSGARKALYRVTFLYIALYLLIVLRNVGAPLGWYESVWRKVVPWVAKNVLHLPYEITVFTGGSGDTTYDWVRALCTLALAGAGAAVWSLFDRKRDNYERLDDWLRVAVRFSVMATMIVYGAVKVIPTQFPPPSLDRLLQPIGDASPMGLLWTFIGASTSYNIFTGFTELLGGLLLWARRTTGLGALVCIGVMGNVFMMNMSYDVPVKLLSFHMILLSTYLVLPDARRFARVLLLNRAAEEAILPRLFERTWLHRTALAVRAVVTVGFLAHSLYGSQQIRYRFGDLAPRSPLYGIWEVEEFEADGTARPPLLTDDMRWKRLVFDRPQSLSVYQMNDARTRYPLTLDLEGNTLALTRREDPNWKGHFTLARPEPDILQLQGNLAGKSVKAKLRRVDIGKKFLLTSRGFHWISEAPYNR